MVHKFSRREAVEALKVPASSSHETREAREQGQPMKSPRLLPGSRLGSEGVTQKVYDGLRGSMKSLGASHTKICWRVNETEPRLGNAEGGRWGSLRRGESAQARRGGKWEEWELARTSFPACLEMKCVVPAGTNRLHGRMSQTFPGSCLIWQFGYSKVRWT